jgi:hypothetical protein
LGDDDRHERRTGGGPEVVPDREGVAGKPSGCQQGCDEGAHGEYRHHRAEEPERAPQNGVVHEAALDRGAVEQVAGRWLGPEGDC